MKKSASVEEEFRASDATPATAPPTSLHKEQKSHTGSGVESASSAAQPRQTASARSANAVSTQVQASSGTAKPKAREPLGRPVTAAASQMAATPPAAAGPVETAAADSSSNGHGNGHGHGNGNGAVEHAAAPSRSLKELLDLGELGDLSLDDGAPISSALVEEQEHVTGRCIECEVSC